MSYKLLAFKNSTEQKLRDLLDKKYIAFKELMVSLVELETLNKSQTINEYDRNNQCKRIYVELKNRLELALEVSHELKAADTIVDETKDFTEYGEQMNISKKILNLQTAQQMREFIEDYLNGIQQVQKQLLVRYQWLKEFQSSIQIPEVVNKVIFRRCLHYWFDDQPLNAQNDPDRLSQLIQYFKEENRQEALPLVNCNALLAFVQSLIKQPEFTIHSNYFEQNENPTISVSTHIPATFEVQSELDRAVLAQKIKETMCSYFNTNLLTKQLKEWLDSFVITEYFLAQQFLQQNYMQPFLKEVKLPFYAFGPMPITGEPATNGFLNQFVQILFGTQVQCFRKEEEKGVYDWCSVQGVTLGYFKVY
ncbi:Conserved_hypothetical protein [Hexamita inflata]|uniref:Uncharacterized protein n=1 Tax=Hexamita inflata TaxID=28002 RepID=A0AA86UX45_9EUKA|nr:Conserved hypothetical protein [Hexamita inflata]